MSSTSDKPTDEFYINYAPAPRSYQRFLFRFIPLLVIGSILFSVVFPGLHNQFNSARIQGTTELEGLLVGEPVPHLIVPRPGNVASQVPFTRYLLSGTGKSTPRADVLEQVGQWVKLTGTLISRNQLSIIAVRGAEPVEPPADVTLNPADGNSLGSFSLTGEILDSKCYLGTMKPGQGKTHRACAIRCISGGVPAVFRVQNSRDDVMYFLLVDGQGQAVNDRVLDLVADPVRITGTVMQYDDLFVLEAEPSTYERV